MNKKRHLLQCRPKKEINNAHFGTKKQPIHPSSVGSEIYYIIIPGPESSALESEFSYLSLSKIHVFSPKKTWRLGKGKLPRLVHFPGNIAALCSTKKILENNHVLSLLP